LNFIIINIYFMMFLWTLLVSLCIEYTFLTNPPEAQACMDQDMHVQLRTSTATRPQLAGVFTTKNRVEWCRESGELHLYSHGVQKYSFQLRFRKHPTKGRWQAWGQCTSGRKVKVEMHLDAQEMHWLRIEYPEYRFLHIFAIDADQMDEALGRTTIPEIMVSSDFNLLIRQQMRGRLGPGKRE